ncbi:MAG: substrate-binding domain-containing protein, partial [Desulfobulbia bacterium]
AMISGMTEGNDRASDRVSAVRDCLETACLLSSDLNLIEAEYSLNSGAESLSKLWELHPRPTAIICGNGVLAAGAVNRALEMGLRVPEDISITGYDDIELATVVRPKLTTVHVPHRRMGKTAAQKLLEMKNGNSTVVSKKLTAEIVVRETLGTPVS